MKYTDKKDQRNIRRLTLVFSLIVLVVLIVVLGVLSVAAFALVEVGAIASEDGITTWHIIIFMAIASVVLGTIISFITSKMILSPLNMMTSKIKSLSKAQKYLKGTKII